MNGRAIGDSTNAIGEIERRGRSDRCAAAIEALALERSTCRG
jgi:hypothetical protein